MPYINLSAPTEVLSLAAVMARFPCNMFPSDSAYIDFASLGFAAVVDGVRPEIDEMTQQLQLGPIECQDGVWTQTYAVQALPQEQIDLARQQQRLREYQQGKAVVELHLNQAAQERDYDTIHAAVIRAAYPGPYQQEGIAYGVWMDACWQNFFALTAAAEAAGQVFPSDDEILAAMDELNLPSSGE
jgi:hypothetical protein